MVHVANYLDPTYVMPQSKCNYHMPFGDGDNQIMHLVEKISENKCIWKSGFKRFLIERH